jgi:hypothetical protein
MVLKNVVLNSLKDRASWVPVYSNRVNIMGRIKKKPMISKNTEEENSNL